VSLGELYDFVYDRVRERTPNQTPSKWEFGLRGDLHVARNPHRRVRAVELAPELLDLVRHPLPGGRSAAVRELARIAAGDDLEELCRAGRHAVDGGVSGQHHAGGIRRAADHVAGSAPSVLQRLDAVERRGGAGILRGGAVPALEDRG
jgi:hypothetical protein